MVRHVNTVEVDILHFSPVGFCFFHIGDYDHLPEQAFYMVGPIEEAVAKADKLAEEHS